MDSDDFLNDDPGSLSDSVPASNVNPGISPHNEPALHEDLRVNMDFPILPSESQSIHCINCGTEITHRRRHIVNLVEVQRVILQWIAPQVTVENSFVCHPCWIIALNASISVQGSSSDASTSSDPGRHRQLCVNCRCSLLRIRSHGLNNDTERERHIRSVILQWIHPHELTAFDRICHPCWQRADRHSTRHNVGRDAIDDVQQGDNAEIQQGSDSGVQVAAGSIFLPNMRRAPDTQSHCFVPDCNAEERLRIPLWLRVYIFSEYNYYVPQQCRICEFHLRNDNFDILRNEMQSIQYFTASHIEDFASFVKERVILDFTNIQQMSDDSVHYWTGLNKHQFFELKTDVQQINNMRNGTLALAAYLMKIRTGDSNERISTLLNTPPTTLVRILKKVRQILIDDFVPRNLGINHITRAQIAARNLMIPNELFGGVDRNPIIILDGTYLYVQKSSNYLYQKDTYSLHKYRNLMKPFMMVCSDGYIIDVLGPYPATTSDAAIMINEFNNETNTLRRYFQPGDVFLLDRGFRDSVPLLQQCNYTVHFPISLQQGETQLSTAAANKSRTVTMCRWIVEAVNGIFKMSYKIFRSEFFNTASTHAMTDFKIAAALINKFHQRVSDRPDARQILNVVNEKLHTNNLLADYVIENNLNRRRTQFLNLNATIDNVEFPRLTFNELVLLACGTYQIKQAKSYYGEHIRNDGSYTIEVCIDRASDLLQGFHSVENCTLLRGKIQSRHISRKIYFVYILYEDHTPGIRAIKQYYCNCIVGRRTVGCCAHIMSVIWYLSWARYENVNPPAQFLEHVLLTYDNE